MTYQYSPYTDYPETWQKIPFCDCCADATSGSSKIKKEDYQRRGVLPIIDQGKEAVGGYVDDLTKQCSVELPCILFGDHTKIFKYCDKPFALGADGVKVLKPTNKFDERFLYHYLCTLKLPDNAGYSRHFKYLRKTCVPLPPLSEQKRIAAILDKADAIRRKRKAALDMADEFLRATFLDMFGDPVTNPKGWDVKPLGKFGKITTGNTPPRKQTELYGDYLEWIKSDNINTPNHFLTQAAEGLSEAGAKKGRVAKEGAVLVTCIAGSKDCIGNAAIATKRVAFNQQINAIEPRSTEDTSFIYSACLVNKRLVQQASTESMKGLVSKGRFQAINLIDPPEELRKSFYQSFIKIVNLTGKNAQSFKEADALFASLSQRAFRGEL
jgi:type I restriction enzyme S subunit